MLGSRRLRLLTDRWFELMPEEPVLRKDVHGRLVFSEQRLTRVYIYYKILVMVPLGARHKLVPVFDREINATHADEKVKAALLQGFEAKKIEKVNQERRDRHSSLKDSCREYC